MPGASWRWRPIRTVSKRAQWGIKLRLGSELQSHPRGSTVAVTAGREEFKLFSSDVHTFRRIYLADHRAAAGGGVAVATRLRDVSSGPAHEILTTLVHGLESDRDELDEVIDRMGVRSSVLKRLAVRSVEWLGRAKLNGRLFRRSPLSSLEEFEFLLSGLTAQRSMWLSLELIAGQVDGLFLDQVTDMCRRTGEQSAALETCRSEFVDASLAR